MPEHPLRPVESPAGGRVITDHDPALWRIAQLRLRDHLTRRGGVFHVGIPPTDPTSREGRRWRWTWRSRVAVMPPGTYSHRDLDDAEAEPAGPAASIFTERRLRWETVPSKDLDDWKTMSWPEAATALLGPARLIHGWEPQWNRTAPATVAGRPGTRVPLVLTLPWSDPRSYGDSLQPHWMHIDAEEAEVVIDDERGVILEWNGLVNGQAFERNAFTAIDFDILLAAGDLDPTALGLTNHRP